MMRLICTLTQHVITPGGDFVPKGTPVQVIGWSGNDKGGEVDEQGRVEVRATAYMYADSFDYDDVAHGYSHGCVGGGADGLFLSVPPDYLAYASSGEWAVMRRVNGGVA